MKRGAEFVATVALGAAVIFLETGHQLESARAFFHATVYVFAGAWILVFAALLLQGTAFWFAAQWRARRFPACAVHDFNGLPCMLPDGHPDREHATAWIPVPGLEGVEFRHRFDDVATEGREERRHARGILLDVSRTGDTMADIVTK